METAVLDAETLAQMRLSAQASRISYGSGANNPPRLLPFEVRIERHGWAEFVDDCIGILDDLPLLYEIYAGGGAEELSALFDWGIAPARAALSKALARSGRMPALCRIDALYSTRGLAIAELQWSSGGLAYFTALADALDLPVSPSETAASRLAHVLTGECECQSVTNLCRSEWLPAEDWLARQMAAHGIRYRALDRRNSEHVLGSVARGREGRTCFYGQGYTELVSDDLLSAHVSRALSGDVWLEVPPVYLLRQKWWYALAVGDELSKRFHPAWRRRVPPVALLHPLTSVRWSQLGEQLAHQEAERLLDGQSLLQLAALPESLRRNIVLKCAGGVSGFSSNGKGVFRLSGGRGQVGRLLRWIDSRVAACEPWIAQPFHSSAIELRGSDDHAYARIMMFFGRVHGAWKLLFCLCNLGRHWKVTASSPSEQEQPGFARLTVH
jgi:hypothetical protein